MKKFRACVSAIMFSQKLPKYNEEVIEKRKEMLNNFRKKDFNKQMNTVQKWLANSIEEFLKELVQKN